MKITAVLYFLSKGVKLHFYCLGTIFEENMRVSRGVKFLGSGFPIGARASLLAHNFAWQSVVCYTLCLRCCENAVARGGHATGFETAGKQAVFVVRITINAGLVSSAGRAYMKKCRKMDLL